MAHFQTTLPVPSGATCSAREPCCAARGLPGRRRGLVNLTPTSGAHLPPRRDTRAVLGTGAQGRPLEAPHPQSLGPICGCPLLVPGHLSHPCLAPSSPEARAAGVEGTTRATWACGNPGAKLPRSAHKGALSLRTELVLGGHMAADRHRLARPTGMMRTAGVHGHTL